MIEALSKHLDVFERDPNVHVILLTSASEKAFCAGGDVKSIAIAAHEHQTAGGDPQVFQDFFRHEYMLNTRIFNCEKPFVSLIDGICMGGGVGLSMHGSHRVITERASFAMPEVKIGFFPDVGGGYLLSRLKQGMGAYLAMTGLRIGAADMMYLGLGTHFMDSGAIDHLVQNLITMDWGRSDVHSVLNATLSNYCEDQIPESSLSQHKGEINHVFQNEDFDHILSSLSEGKSDWSQDTLGMVNQACPLSARIAFDHIQACGGRDFEDVMIDEYRLSQFFMMQSDFYEGVRAVLIDKDHSAKWESRFETLDSKTYQDALSHFDGQDLAV